MYLQRKANGTKLVVQRGNPFTVQCQLNDKRYTSKRLFKLVQFSFKQSLFDDAFVGIRKQQKKITQESYKMCGKRANKKTLIGTNTWLRIAIEAILIY